MEILRHASALVELRRDVRRGLARDGLAAVLERADRGPRWSMPLPARWVFAVSRRLRTRDETCLLRSLALYTALRRLGHAPAFVIGVDIRPSGLIAHAWVELGGLPPDLDATRFTPIFRHSA